MITSRFGCLLDCRMLLTPRHVIRSHLKNIHNGGALFVHKSTQRSPLSPQAFTAKQTAILTKSSGLKNMKPVGSEGKKRKQPLPPGNDFSTSVFYDPVVHRFRNIMMRYGNKHISRRLLDDAFELIKIKQLEKRANSSEFVETDPLKIFHIAMENAQPVIGAKTMKIRSGKIKVPFPLTASRKQFLAVNWFVEMAQELPNDYMHRQLSCVILDAYKNEGLVIKKKVQFHKLAEANRHLAHYRWW